MGMMVDGVWRDIPRDTKSTGGAFVPVRKRVPRAARRSRRAPFHHAGKVRRGLRLPLQVQRALLRALTLAALLLACGGAAANSDPLAGVAAPGGVGIGVLPRIERSPYVGAGMRHDFLPLYLYEGERVYLHSQSVGVKFGPSEARRFEFFLKRRLEGH